MGSVAGPDRVRLPLWLAVVKDRSPESCSSVAAKKAILAMFEWLSISLLIDETAFCGGFPQCQVGELRLRVDQHRNRIPRREKVGVLARDLESWTLANGRLVGLDGS